MFSEALIYLLLPQPASVGPWGQSGTQGDSWRLPQLRLLVCTQGWLFPQPWLIPVPHPIFHKLLKVSQNSWPTDDILHYFRIAMCLLALKVFTGMCSGTLCRGGRGDGDGLCLLP